MVERPGCSVSGQVVEETRLAARLLLLAARRHQRSQQHPGLVLFVLQRLLSSARRLAADLQLLLNSLSVATRHTVSLGCTEHGLVEKACPSQHDIVSLGCMECSQVDRLSTADRLSWPDLAGRELA